MSDAEGAANNGMPKGDVDFLLACIQNTVGGGMIVSSITLYEIKIYSTSSILHPASHSPIHERTRQWTNTKC